MVESVAPTGYKGIYHALPIGREVDALKAIEILEPGETTLVAQRYGSHIHPDDLLWTYVEMPLGPFEPFVQVLRPKVSRVPNSLLVEDYRARALKGGGKFPPLVFAVDRQALMTGHQRLVGWWDAGLALVPILLVVLRGAATAPKTESALRIPG